jgi:signal transduction histidine kinase
VTVLGPLPEVQAHPEVLERVLTNLLENALKFVRAGVAPRIRLWTEPRGSVVRLWIEDNGMGIDPQYHERIFKVFESLYPSQSQQGTGMGLAIVKQGAQRLGGQVGVESRVGAGSRFWVEFQGA